VEQQKPSSQEPRERRDGDESLRSWGGIERLVCWRPVYVWETRVGDQRERGDVVLHAKVVV